MNRFDFVDWRLARGLRSKKHAARVHRAACEILFHSRPTRLSEQVAKQSSCLRSPLRRRPLARITPK